MPRAFPDLAALACAVCAAAGCAQPPPTELAGLWAQGPGGCAAGLGVRFDADAVWLVADEAQTALLPAPRYQAHIADDGALAVTIRYQPDWSADAADTRLVGEARLERDVDGVLRLVSHHQRDARTGAARARFATADPLDGVFRLRRCGDGAWIGGLRGRSEQKKSAVAEGATAQALGRVDSVDDGLRD